jgi:hypothetical protein
MIPKKGRTYVVYSPCELCDHLSFLFCKIDPFVSVLAGTLFDRCPEGRADPAGGAPASGCSSTDPRSPRLRGGCQPPGRKPSRFDRRTGGRLTPQPTVKLSWRERGVSSSPTCATVTSPELRGLCETFPCQPREAAAGRARAADDCRRQVMK